MGAPFSNEYVKKVLLGASIVAGGIGLMGSASPVYAANLDQPSAVIETVKKEAVAPSQVQDSTGEVLADSLEIS